MSPDEKLVYSANQIAKFFAAQGETRAIAGVADHLQRFWDPTMRARLLELSERPNIALLDTVRKALPQLH
ncbi:MAG TPA: formate dehydrogenase subunit delta [Rhizomicrobium sp.]|nr:formate dehydrogenase subunit delta [Rhizomicrobium sp.]